MKAGFSLWVQNEKGDKIFGKGPFELLTLVEKHGSLNQASSQMGMSYSKALNIIKRCEKEFGVKMLIREIGGSKGGGSYLTYEAKDLLSKYQMFKNEASKEIERLFEDVFNPLISPPKHI